MDFKKLLRDEDHQNYCCIYRGLAYVGQNLEPYTKNGITRIHQKIYRKLASHGDCTTQCSKSFGADFSRWCDTCTSWRKNLLAELRSSKRKSDIKWDDVKSWEWPKSYESIADLFLPWSMPSVQFQDIASQCHIWVSCSEFDIQNHVTKRLKKFRNTYFGHNPSLRATELEKSNVFDMLRDLIKDPDVKQDLNVNKCLNELQQLENMDDLSATVSEIHQSLTENSTKIEIIDRELKKIEYSQQLAQDDLFQTQLELRNEVNHCHQLLIKSCENARRKKQENSRNVTGIIVIPFILAIFSILIYKLFKGENRGYFKVEESLSGCLSETYSYPFMQDLPLVGYLSEHKKLTGRQWLIEDLESTLVLPGNTENGIVLVAEMGFGKSAIISHLLCCKKGEVGHKVRNHIVAFHVCKYDVEATQNVERFIRRLTALLASHSEEYGNIISMLPSSSIIYDRKACEEEMIACFDQGITFPLKKLSTDNIFPWIILLDGLDECFYSPLRRNFILELLTKRMKHMPYWIKFIITSRNMTSLSSLKKLKMIYLQSNDPRNVKDIHEYMKDTLAEHTHLSETLDLYLHNNLNFLYITHALQYIRAKDNDDAITSLPLTLGDILEDNFDRYFSVYEDFIDSKVILEIICASFRPLDTNELLDVIRANNKFDADTFRYAIDKLPFILRFEKHVTLPHQAVYYWLIDHNNTKYRISIESGHSYIARYMFSKFSQDQNYSEDIIDFIIHISESGDIRLRKEFANFVFSHTAGVKMKFLLHRLIWKTSSVEALALLLNHISDIEELNEGGVNAAFVAAARGNLDQLKMLHNKGANINFILSGHFVISNCNVSYKINFIKQKLYLGYGLIHIAAQHGHENIVNYLIEQNVTTIHLKNVLGLRASDIACENGHINVILKIKKWSPSILDNKCLYYASKWNHIAIVQLLIENGVRLECISDEQVNESLREVASISDKNMTSVDDYVFKLHRYCHNVDVEVYPLDVWWVIMQENPLFAAIKMSSLDVAKLLIKTFPDTLYCVDSFGYTASLSSVFFGQTSLLPWLSGHLVKDTCKPAISLSKRSKVVLSSNEYTYASGCPLGASFAHLVAIHSQNELLKFTLDNRLFVNWTATDVRGNHPEHYAASNDNMLYLSFSKERLNHDISKLKTNNGSTIFHLVSLTSSYFSFKYLTDGYFSNVPDLKDEYELGMLHYLVLRVHFKEAENMETEETLHLITLYMFQKLVEYYNHDINHVDTFGRNILHYALRFGHYRIVHYLYTKHITLFHQLLSKKDKNSIYPFSFAILLNQRVEKDNENGYYSDSTFTVPSERIYQIYAKCLKNHECKRLMTPWELSLLYVIQNLNSTEFILYIEPHLSEIIDKSLHLTKAVMIYDRTLSDAHLARHLVKVLTIKQIPRKHTLKTIVLYRPHAFYMCGTSISPMHHVAKRGGIGLLDMLVYQLYISVAYNSAFLNCSDSNGLNIIHKALLAGNIRSAEKLLFYNMEVLNDYIGLNDIVFMAFSKPVLNGEYLLQWEKGPEDAEVIDNFLSEFLRRNKHSIEIFQVCCRYCKSISGIHMSAAYNLGKTTETMVNLYGKHVLNCVNKDGFTPFYFAKIFENNKFISSYGGSLKLKIPERHAELHLLISFLAKFPNEGMPNICKRPNSLIPGMNIFKYVRLRHVVNCYENLIFYIGLERNSLFYCKIHKTHLLYSIPIINTIVKITHSLQSSTRHHYTCHQGKSIFAVFRALCETLRRLKNSYIFLENTSSIEYYKYWPLITRHLDRTINRCQGCEDGYTCKDNDSNIRLELTHFLASAKNIILLTFRNLRLVLLHCRVQVAQKHLNFIGNQLQFLRNRLPTSDNFERECIKASADSNFHHYMAVLKNAPAYKDIQKKIDDDITNELLGIQTSISIGPSIHYKSIQPPFSDLETD
ncbi:uncharacterized protein LOC128557751 [Mercenaria mercenaria]|uniref:uncharacterized protein LOC128557751 n=1 Tax=Mercenaria mercenaria TaxID=6596 RepID=UPI00234FA529|nr:uncharacterized protein LOC128557751 [Mercenaria mercenaria]